MGDVMDSDLGVVKSTLIRAFREEADLASEWLNKCGDMLHEKGDLKGESTCKGIGVFIKQHAEKFIEGYKNNDLNVMLLEYGMIFYFTKRLLEETEDIDAPEAKVRAQLLVEFAVEMIFHFVKTVPDEERKNLRRFLKDLSKYL